MFSTSKASVLKGNSLRILFPMRSWYEEHRAQPKYPSLLLFNADNLLWGNEVNVLNFMEDCP